MSQSCFLISFWGLVTRYWTTKRTLGSIAPSSNACKREVPHNSFILFLFHLYDFSSLKVLKILYLWFSIHLSDSWTKFAKSISFLAIHEREKNTIKFFPRSISKKIPHSSKSNMLIIGDKKIKISCDTPEKFKSLYQFPGEKELNNILYSIKETQNMWSNPRLKK